MNYQIPVKKHLSAIAFFTAVVVVITLNYNGKVLTLNEFLAYGFKLALISFCSFCLCAFLLSKIDLLTFSNKLFFISSYLFGGLFIFYIISEFMFKDIAFQNVHSSLVIGDVYIAPLTNTIVYLVMYISFIRLTKRIEENERIYWAKKQAIQELQITSLRLEYEQELSKVQPEFFNTSLEKAKSLLEHSVEDAEQYIIRLSNYFRESITLFDIKYSHLIKEVERVKEYCFLASIDENITLDISLNYSKMATGLLLFIGQQSEENKIEITIRSFEDIIEIVFKTHIDIYDKLSSFLKAFYENVEISNNNGVYSIKVPE